MIRIEAHTDHTPTQRLAAAIHQANPHLATTHDPHRADLTIYPRPTNPWAGRPLANPHAWYDLYWTRQAPVTITDPLTGEQHCEMRPVRIRRAGTLPPPPVIPAADRLAATPPANLDGMDARHITLLGGPDMALRLAADRRRQAVYDDRTTDIYDWTALAQAVVDLAAALEAPRLDGAR